MKTIRYRGNIKEVGAFGRMSLGNLNVKRRAKNGEIIRVRGADCTRLAKYWLSGPMERIEFQVTK